MAKRTLDKRLSIRIDDELYERLEQLRQRGYNTSIIVTKAVNDRLDEIDSQHYKL